MRPLLQHASRSIFANVVLLRPSQSSRSSFTTLATSAPGPLSICLRCQVRTSIDFQPSFKIAASPHNLRPLRRRFHQTPNEERRPPDEKEPSSEPRASPDADETAAAGSHPSPKKEVVDNIARVPAEDLPSHREAQRWDLSKRLTELMDELLPKLAVVTQKVNTYTGTDYSGIEALRREIKDQEKLVKARRAAIEEAKQALDAAHSQQASSQKEVVALLERKHSWSATDLERYMSLIRSEHVNDQAVREAKEAVAAAENALEEARSQLEKRERAQYHEEQIWSDTIRRNSTWVTFVLMGFNILLLLTSLAIIEPWRRRRMVREIKTALEAQKASIESAAATEPQPVLPAPALEAIKAEIDEVVEPVGRPLESTTAVEPSISASLTEGKLEAAVEETTHVQDTVPDDTVEPTAPGAAALTSERLQPQEAIDIEEVKAATIQKPWHERISASVRDLISERTISIRKIDLTTAILQSAAVGAVISAAVIALLRPR